MLAIIIIAVAGVYRSNATINSVPIIGGIVAMGVLLMILSLLGFFAAISKKRGLIFAVCVQSCMHLHSMPCIFSLLSHSHLSHTRPWLQYIFLMGLLWIIQFAVSIAVLSFSAAQQKQLVENGWFGLCFVIS